MASKLKSNLILINAPAGSGKTTTIENRVISLLALDPNNQILCITYTNRAAKELMERIDNSNVKIQTIHAFINEFISLYFKHNEAIDVFFDIYGDKIKKDIENEKGDLKISEKNQRFIDKNEIDKERLNYDYIRNSVKELSYNQLAFDNLYRGRIGHDGLLKFTNAMVLRFPVLCKRLSDKYDHIFIDEYQDTSSSVLEIFYHATKSSKATLYLLGDKMQQIYQNYDGNFEESLTEFDTSTALRTNYRSSPQIVNVLNEIYNDKRYSQKSNNKNNDKPKIIITGDYDVTLADNELIYSDSLFLYVFNKDRFKAIGAENLYNAVDKMENYGYLSKYSVVDVLTKSYEDNPDDLMKSILIITSVLELYEEKKYGDTIQKIKKNKLFNNEKIIVNYNSDKSVFKIEIDSIVNEYREKEHTLISFFEMLCDREFINLKIIQPILNNPEYEAFLSVDIEEYKKLQEYLKCPRISTQHGVKGEGYDSVVFISDNSTNPSVKMYEFFRLFSINSIDLIKFQEFHYDFTHHLIAFEKENSFELSDLNANYYNSNKETYDRFVNVLFNKYSGNLYFDFLFKDLFEKFLKKPNATNLKPCLKNTPSLGVLSAYKLFYVGCSRAKKDLTVLVNSANISNYRTAFIKKMSSIGFDVIEKD
jgi:DNA helicase-2/ATP-dependent DNA helicase PcrA